MKEYCYHCGLKLIIKNTYIENYDQQTGKPKYNTSYKCPKNKSWNIFSLHDDGNDAVYGF